MADKLFAVVLDEPNEEVLKRLKEKHDNTYCHTSTFFVVPVRQNVTTDDVAHDAGIKGKKRDVTGIVFKINSAYSGYTKKNLWELLSSYETL
ncbi:MAG: hypothetical protein F4W92_06170 [Gammaproteobacteria bacterium]|nr:hypothetical protein [Gammaproteobacteria bacterium]